MTAEATLRRAVQTLRANRIDDPEIEAEVLLRHVLGLDRAYLFLRLPQALTVEQEEAYQRLLTRRLQRTPSAYLTGRREFYSLQFAVGPGVLIPRPETEHVVEAVLEVGRELLRTREHLTFVDVGTGSGAIALAVAKHLPALHVLATDISPAALAVADLNAKRLRLAGRVTLLQGDLLEPVHEPFQIVAANLPYIPTDVWASLPPEIRAHEPRLALDGGADGLRLIERLLTACAHELERGDVAILEVSYDQVSAVRVIAAERLPGAVLEVRRDLAGHERVVIVRV